MFGFVSTGEEMIFAHQKGPRALAEAEVILLDEQRMKEGVDTGLWNQQNRSVIVETAFSNAVSTITEINC